LPQHLEKQVPALLADPITGPSLQTYPDWHSNCFVPPCCVAADVVTIAPIVAAAVMNPINMRMPVDPRAFHFVTVVTPATAANQNKTELING
jgi:hypothetical protein